MEEQGKRPCQKRRHKKMTVLRNRATCRILSAKPYIIKGKRSAQSGVKLILVSTAPEGRKKPGKPRGRRGEEE